MVKIATIIFIIMLVYAGAYSISGLIMPQIFVNSTYEIITGEALADVQNEGHVDAYLGMSRSSNLFALCTVIAGFFVLFGAFRKKEKWAWWSFLIVGGTAWVWGLVNGIFLGASLYLIMQLIGMILFLAGILIPIKTFFGKKT